MEKNLARRKDLVISRTNFVVTRKNLVITGKDLYKKVCFIVLLSLCVKWMNIYKTFIKLVKEILEEWPK